MKGEFEMEPLTENERNGLITTSSASGRDQVTNATVCSRRRSVGIIVISLLIFSCIILMYKDSTFLPPSSGTSAADTTSSGLSLEESIKGKYGLDKASKQDAVDAAVEYLAGQQKAIEEEQQNGIGEQDATDEVEAAQPGLPPSQIDEESSTTPANTKQNDCHAKHSDEFSIYSCSQAFALSNNAPPCKISMSELKTRMMVIYSASALPRYDDSCGLLRSRYHTAPTCQAEEAEITPGVHHYRMVYIPAFEGTCVAPDVSPRGIAKAFRDARSDVGDSNRPVNIFFMGLSFMGQPFMSYVCLNEDSLSFAHNGGGWVLAERQKSSETQFVPLEEVLAENGKCSGYSRDHIADWYPPEIHPRTSLPSQNVHSCNSDAAYVHFGPNSPDSEDDVNICYKYTFNLASTVQRGQHFGCNRKASFGAGFDLRSTDVIFALHSVHELREYYFPRITPYEGAGVGVNLSDYPNLSVVSVLNIYEALVLRLLREAQQRNGVPTWSDVQRDYHNFEMTKARPQACMPKPPDVHYRLPGLTDMAVEGWMALFVSDLVGRKSGLSENEQNEIYE